MIRRRRRAAVRARAAASALLPLALGACTVPSVLLPNHRLLRDVYVRGPSSVPVVALTFDDGPNGRCTAEILDALAEHATPATFFVLGRNLRHADNAALLARMVRDGHTIGLHGWAHSTNPMMEERWAAREIARTRDAVLAAARAEGVPEPPLRFYRPAYGFLTGAMARAAEAAGLVIVEWTVSVEDWRRGWTADTLSDGIARAARAGDVIVLHDGDETAHVSVRRCIERPLHAEAIRRLVPALAARGLRVATLAEVLALPPSH